MCSGAGILKFDASWSSFDNNVDLNTCMYMFFSLKDIVSPCHDLKLLINLTEIYLWFDRNHDFVFT